MSPLAPLPFGVQATGPEEIAPGQTHRFFWFAVALATIVGAFILPMAFPPTTFLRSAAYMAGFNNSVASLAVIFISLAVTAWLVWKGLGARVAPTAMGQAMPLRWLAFASAYAAVFTSVFGTLLARADINYVDIGYWQYEISMWSQTHAILYRDFEFAYGPILFYWPAYIEKGLGHFGVAPIAGYMLAQGLIQILGLLILFYLLQQLPLSRRLKGIALATITFGTLTPLLGINYTMFRFAAGFAALLWITKFRSVLAQAALAALAEAFLLAISPEVGISFAGGIIAYALYRGILTERRWLWIIPAPVVAFGIFALCIDKNYFFTMKNFSAGLEAEIVQPFPYIDVFLISAVVLCPLAIAGYIRRYGRSSGPIVGLYIACLALVPSALGRCDVLHVFFAWIGFFILSLVGIDAYRPKSAKLALALLIALALISQGLLFYGVYPELVKKAFFRKSNTGGFDLQKLERTAAHEHIYLPVMAPPFVARALLADGLLEPSYFDYTMNAETVPGIRRKLDEMHHATFVLMPMDPMRWITSQPMNNWAFRIFRLGYRYPKNRPFFNTGVIIADDLKTNYDPVAVFGTVEHEQYLLYRRKNQPLVTLSEQAFTARAVAIGAATVTP